MYLTRIKRRAQGFVGQNEVVEKQDLRSLSASLSRWFNTSFEHCEMGLSDFTGVVTADTTSFGDCRLYGSKWRAATMDNSGFYECDLEQADFEGAVLRGVYFRGCRLSYASFRGATFRDVRFVDCNLHGTDLDIIEGHDVHFSDSNLWGAKMALGCAVFNGTFDTSDLRRLVALAARRFPPGEDRDTLIRVSGKEFSVVSRLMEDRHAKEEADVRPEEAPLKKTG